MILTETLMFDAPRHETMENYDCRFSQFPILLSSATLKKALPEIYFLAWQALVVLNVTLSKRAWERGL